MFTCCMFLQTPVSLQLSIVLSYLSQQKLKAHLDMCVCVCIHIYISFLKFRCLICLAVIILFLIFLFAAIICSLSYFFPQGNFLELHQLIKSVTYLFILWVGFLLQKQKLLLKWNIFVFFIICFSLISWNSFSFSLLMTVIPISQFFKFWSSLFFCFLCSNLTYLSVV